VRRAVKKLRGKKKSDIIRPEPIIDSKENSL
jgi:hypothetical protein